MTGWLLKSCPRCGGDVVAESTLSDVEPHVGYLSCILCGDLRFVEAPPMVISPDAVRARPGRPRKSVAAAAR